MKDIKKHIIFSIAGVLTITQWILLFVLNIEGIAVIRYVGYIVWGLSLFFGVAPIFILKRKGKVTKKKSYIHTTVIVDSGLYAVVRHPQYLALPLLNLALILFSQHLIIISLGIVSMFLMFIDISKADQYNIEKFGDEYRQYMKRVPSTNFILGIIRLIRREKERK